MKKKNIYGVSCLFDVLSVNLKIVNQLHFWFKSNVIIMTHKWQVLYFIMTPYKLFIRIFVVLILFILSAI